MKIVVIGAGYVGLVSGACFAELGVDVTCVDSDSAKVEALRQGHMPIYEPGLEEMVAANHKAGRLRFTTDPAAAVREADAVVLAVGTPQDAGGKPDLRQLEGAVAMLAPALGSRQTLVVVKSTVPVGTTRRAGEKLRALNPKAAFEVASNPEFLREGTAIQDFMAPDRVVAGVQSEQARDLLARLHAPIAMKGSPLFFTTLESAELIKYASNCFLATKIAFVNEMADLCEKTGANIRDVARGMGLDERIGGRFLQPGPGFGGSCLPKDTQGLAAQARAAGAPSRLVEAVIDSNTQRKRRMADKIITACGGSVKGQTLGVLGLTFKPGTDDMRESPSLAIVPLLLAAGATLRAYDPQGMAHARALLPDGIEWCADAYEACQGTDALVILTEWNEFRSLDFARLGPSMRRKLVIDLRNIYKRRDMQAAGFRYVSLGRSETTAGQREIRDLSLPRKKA